MHPNLNQLFRSSFALALVAAVAAQGPAAPGLTARRHAGFAGIPAVESPLLELRLVGTPVPAALELRGGVAGSLATIALADSTTAPPTFGHGTFDSDGCFSLALATAFAERGFVCQGYAGAFTLEGRWQMQASNGLEVTVPAPAPATAPSDTPLPADASLLRIQLDPWHGTEVKDEVLAKDLVGALAAALNSHGDTLLAKLSGKLMVIVPGTPVQIGGAVAFAAKIAREGEEYVVSIGQEVAVLCGVKAAKNIGVEGGVTLGGDQIYRFASPGEVARGLVGIALQQALPGKLQAASGENLARVRVLRQHIAELFAAIDQLRARRTCRRPLAEFLLDQALGALVTLHGRMRRIGDALDRAAGWVVDEAQFVRDHSDGAEMRLAATCEVSLEIGDKKFGDRFGAELGGKMSGGYQLTVRMFQVYGREPHRVEVTVAHAFAAGVAAGIKLGLTDEVAFNRGFEVTQSVTRGMRSTFVRVGNDFGSPELAVVIKREFRLLNFGRETTIEFDAALLGSAGQEALAALLDGEAAAALQALASIRAQVAVQDRLSLALKPELGVENTALTAKVGGEFSWADCGAQRTVQLSLATVLERLLDPSQCAADARALVEQVLAVPHLQ